METKDDASPVKMAVEQLKDPAGGKASSSAESSSAKDGADDRNLLISRLLSQPEDLREEEGKVEKLQQTDDDLKKKMMEEQPSSSLAVDDQGHTDGTENDMGIKSSSRNDEIILRELRELKKQNFITHCLLSAMIVITLTWQLSEVSMIFKLKDGINHPFRSISEMLGFKKEKQLPVFDLNQDEDSDD